MDSALLLSLIGFAFVALMTPGPNNLLLMSSGALFGFRATLPHIVGIQLGFATVMTSAVLGLGALLEAWPALLIVMKIVGAGWLSYMALLFLITAVRSSGTETANPDLTRGTETEVLSRPFRFHEAVLFQWVNLKAILIAISTAGAYSELSPNLSARAAATAAVFISMGFLSSISWAKLGSVLQRFMSGGTSAILLNAAMGLLLLGTAGMILFA